MITFANPAFLWGLVALAVPVAIHLLSRKEGKVIYVGSLRHLQESNTRQSLNIRLNELLLLTLRMLMIAFLILLISGVQWHTNSFSQKKWLLMENTLHKDARLKNVIDSLANNGFESHFLSEGFPLISDSINVSGNWNSWDLLRSLEKEHLTEAVIFSCAHLKNFKGRRIELPANITWIPIESLPEEFNLMAIRESTTNIYLTKGLTSPIGTSFESRKVLFQNEKQFDSIKITDPINLKVSVVSDSSFKDDATIIKAALKAIQNISYSKIEIKESSVATFNDAQSDWVIWLSKKNYTGKGSNNIISYYEDPAAPLISKHANNEWLLSHRLNEGIALKENLPIALSGILFPAKEEWARAIHFDRRSIDESMAWSEKSVQESNLMGNAMSQEDESIWIWGALVLILLIERTIAHQRNQ